MQDVPEVASTGITQITKVVLALQLCCLLVWMADGQRLGPFSLPPGIKDHYLKSASGAVDRSYSLRLAPCNKDGACL